MLDSFLVWRRFVSLGFDVGAFGLRLCGLWCCVCDSIDGRNQSAVLKNQTALNTIITNQKQILAAIKTVVKEVDL